MQEGEQEFVEIDMEEALAHRQRAGYSDAVLKKARKLITKGRLVKTAPDHWTVHGFSGESYDVTMPEGDNPTSTLDWILCTCPNGTARTQPNCYHAAAVMLSVTEPDHSLG